LALQPRQVRRAGASPFPQLTLALRLHPSPTMKLVSLVATLVLGTSAGALAAPESAPPRLYRHSWVALSEPFALTRTWRPIDVEEVGTFTQLRVQTTRGATQLERVIVQFKNRTRQVVDLDQRLDVGAPKIDILLAGESRRIDRVVVVGESSRNATVQVFGI